MDNSFNTNDSYNMNDYYENPKQTAKEVKQMNGTEEPDREYFDDNDDFKQSRLDLLKGDADVVVSGAVDSKMYRNTDKKEDYGSESVNEEDYDNYRI